MANDKIYYINLNRRPDRNEHFLRECSIHNIPFNKIKRYEAIDGLTYNFSYEEESMFSRVDYKDQPYKKNIMGNQLSHLNILKEMIENDYNYILICQDDVIFTNNITSHLSNLLNNIPNDAEIINIGFHRFASYNTFIPWNFNDKNEMIKVKINNYICKLTETTNPCSLAYIVTKRGAKNLISHFNNIGFLRATDWNYNDYLIPRNIHYGSCDVLITGNPNLGSDIFI